MDWNTEQDPIFTLSPNGREGRVKGRLQIFFL
jgi:hypothetical protein